MRVTHKSALYQDCESSTEPLQPAFRSSFASARGPAHRRTDTPMLSPFERMIAKRYLWPGKGEAFIARVAGISIGVVMRSVAMLVIVMSVMNGFRGELLDKIVGLNGHAIVQAYGGKLQNWEDALIRVQQTPEVIDATPLIERPLPLPEPSS